METLSVPRPISEKSSPEERSIAALHSSFEMYRESRGGDVVDTNYGLLEPLTADADDEAPPKLTVCIPAAINHEKPETILRAYDVVAGAAERLDEPVEVTIWANARYDDAKDQGTVTETAEQRYAELRARLASRSSGNLRTRGALQLLPAQEATMSKLRANYMDAVAKDADMRGFGYDHPVMWIDADTTAMSKNTLVEAVARVRNFDGLFVHPTTRFSIDWADGTPLSDMDPATKAVAINEIERRQMTRESLKDEWGWRGYCEESGLTFALGVYVDVGGVDTKRPVDESSSLVTEAMCRRMDRNAAYILEHGLGVGLPPDLGFVPDFLLQHRSKRPEDLMYIADASITMSARRERERVVQDGITGLEDTVTGTEYRLYTDLQQAASSGFDLSGNTASRLVEHLERADAINTITERQMHTVKALVRRYFDQGSTSAGE